MRKNEIAETATGSSKRGQRASRDTRLFASFVIGTLAVAFGFSLAGTGFEQPLLSAAAEDAAAVAAFRSVMGNDETPHLSAGPPPPTVARPLSAERQPFKTAGLNLETRSATRVVISSLGIDADVRSVGYTFTNGSLTYDVPRREAGQYVGTAAPGDRGNAVIGGHVSSRSGTAVFKELPAVKAGDIIDVYRGDTKYQYAVTEIKVVAADATSVMDQTNDKRLTLITCVPGNDFSERLVVVGKLI